MKSYTVFTDGSSRGNPGPGGWAAVVVTPDGFVEECGARENHTTNNRMELTAAEQALEAITKHLAHGATVVIHTDSKYVIQGITQWIQGWVKNNWITKTKDPVLNQDLWQKLLDLSEKHSIEWKYVGGHIGIPANERCDEIATHFADGGKPDLYKGPVADYAIDVTRTTGSNLLADKKASSGNRSKLPAYSYLSLVDGKVMRHKTWAECEARVKGKPAKFKKALSALEEMAIAEEWGVTLD